MGILTQIPEKGKWLKHLIGIVSINEKNCEKTIFPIHNLMKVYEINSIHAHKKKRDFIYHIASPQKKSKRMSFA